MNYHKVVKELNESVELAKFKKELNTTDAIFTAENQESFKLCLFATLDLKEKNGSECGLKILPSNMGTINDETLYNIGLSMMVKFSNKFKGELVNE